MSIYRTIKRRGARPGLIDAPLPLHNCIMSGLSILNMIWLEDIVFFTNAHLCVKAWVHVVHSQRLQDAKDEKARIHSIIGPHHTLDVIIYAVSITASRTDETDEVSIR